MFLEDLTQILRWCRQFQVGSAARGSNGLFNKYALDAESQPGTVPEVEDVRATILKRDLLSGEGHTGGWETAVGIKKGKR